MSNPVFVPLLNPNEPDVLLASLVIQEGQHLQAEELIATFETTKSTADLPAETSGYVVGLRVSEGQTLRAGELICYLAESPEWQPPEPPAADRVSSTSDRAATTEAPAGLRITQPALKLAQESQFDLSQLPAGPLITKKNILAYLEKAASPEASILDSVFDPTAILIYGAGGHGKACLDLLRALGTYRVLGFIDDGRPADQEIMGLPILGGADQLAALFAQGVRLAVNAVGGIGNIAIRVQVFNKLAEAGFACPAIIHPTAFVEPSARLSAGVQVFPHAYIGSEAQVEYGAIVNTGAIISHDCRLEKFVNISPGAILAGEVKCGSHSLVGMGATVNLQVEIGSYSKIGNGATVKSNLPDHGIVRAGGIWPAK